MPNVWIRPNNQRREADAAKQLLTVPDGDHLTLLNVYNQYMQSESCLSCAMFVPTTSELIRPARQELDMDKLPIPACTCASRQRSLPATTDHGTFRRGPHLVERRTKAIHQHPTGARLRILHAGGPQGGGERQLPYSEGQPGK